MTNKDKIKQDIKTYEKHKGIKNLGHLGVGTSLLGTPIAAYRKNKPATYGLLGASFASGFLARRAAREERAALNRIKKFYDLRDSSPVFVLPEILPTQEKAAGVGLAGAAAAALSHGVFGHELSPAVAFGIDVASTPALFMGGIKALEKLTAIGAKKTLGLPMSRASKMVAPLIKPFGNLKTKVHNFSENVVKYKPKSEQRLNAIFAKHTAGQALTPPEKAYYELYKKYLDGEKLSPELLKKVKPGLAETALQKTTGGLAFALDYPFQFLGPFSESQHLANKYIVPAHKFVSKYSPKHADLILDLVEGGQKRKTAITKLKMDKIEVDKFLTDLNQISPIGSAAEGADKKTEEIVKKYFLPDRLPETKNKLLGFRNRLLDARDRGILAAKATGAGVGAALAGGLLGGRRKKNEREQVASELALMNS